MTMAWPHNDDEVREMIERRQMDIEKHLRWIVILENEISDLRAALERGKGDA